MTTTRRGAIASGASLAAFCSMPAMAAINASPDFDLLVLGIQLEKLLQERYIPQARLWQQYLRAVAEAEDGEIADLQVAGHEVTEEQAFTIRCLIIDRMPRKPGELTDGEAQDFWDEVNGQLNDLTNEILSIRPLTLQGLAVQARACSANASHVWENDPDMYDELKFLNRVCEFMGVTPVHTECRA